MVARTEGMLEFAKLQAVPERSGLFCLAGKSASPAAIPPRQRQSAVEPNPAVELTCAKSRAGSSLLRLAP